MSENIGTVRENNQERILGLLRRSGSMTKQEIGSALQLSMPTTLQNVNELLEKGVLEEGGVTESTGGRRAKKIQLNRKAGYCVGVDIGTSSVSFAAVDLTGKLTAEKTLPLAFRDELEVYDEIGDELDQFLKKNRIKSRLLGAGISFPGIIDMQADRILQSHIFGLEYVSLECFRNLTECPVIVENDANCMSYAELASGRRDYVFISLNRTVGGALMQNGQLMKGEGFRAGEVGHMILVPGGKVCYCGKKGCGDAYLSSDVLREGYPSLEAFFEALEAKEPEALGTWERYLDDLAVLATNLRMVLDMPIVIGGEVGSSMVPYMEMLRRKAEAYDRFAKGVDYLFPCQQKELSGAVGAGLLALEEFGSGVLK